MLERREPIPVEVAGRAVVGHVFVDHTMVGPIVGIISSPRGVSLMEDRTQVDALHTGGRQWRRDARLG